MVAYSRSIARNEHGAVLMIGMVMLLMVTLIAVGLVRLSMRHTQVVNNEQVRTEAVVAAHYALDRVINQSFDDGKWADYAGTGKTVDVNLGVTQAADATDGAGAMKVRVRNLTQKRCRKLQNRELFEADGTISAPNRSCVTSNSNSGLTIGSSSGGDPSGCSNILWEMQAEVDSSDSSALNANVPVTQGVELISGTDCS